MEILPAVDVWEGKLARFTVSGPEHVGEPFGGDQLAAAKAYIHTGARWLHVVDMDLAFSGIFTIGSLLTELAATGVAVQASGGVTDPVNVETMLRSGANRVVLGSAALADRVSIAGMLDRFGDSVAVGIEGEGAVIRPRGHASAELPLEPTLDWLRTLDPPRLVVTSVGGVGKGSGPDLELIGRAIETGAAVIAAGGISTLEHLEAVGSAGAVVKGLISISSRLGAQRPPSLR